MQEFRCEIQFFSLHFKTMGILGGPVLWFLDEDYNENYGY